MKYRLFLVKRQIEDIIMFPLILIGRLIAILRPLHKEYDTFYFFPFYHIGGAEKVHADIAKATATKNSIIYFTRKSNNDLFLEDFRTAGCDIRDISRFTDNKWIYFVNIIWRGIISGYINRQKVKTLVFNGQCNFGYKLSPWIKSSIPQIELIHSLCSFSYIRIPFLPFITRTVMISTIRIQEHIDLYKRFDIPLSYADRIQFIMNAIKLPSDVLPKNTDANLVILYVGRSTAEKRVHLIAEIAKQVNEKADTISFRFLGEVKEAIPVDLHPYCHFYGNQSDPKVIASIYQESNILILVSDTEGFPMVIMEGMAYGLAIVSTPVGEIPLHVHNKINGYLLDEYLDKSAVVNGATHYILQLNNDREQLKKMSLDNRSYAYLHFGMNRFINEYRALFDSMRNRQQR